MSKEYPKTYESQFKSLKIYHINDFDQLDDIRFVGNSHEVDMGEIFQVKPDELTTIFSYGANPCISGIVLDHNYSLYCFHSFGEFLTPEQESYMKNSRSGYVGGNIETLGKYQDLFSENHIRILIPPSIIHDFNYVLVKSKNEFKTPIGFYYNYDEFPLD